MKGFIRMPASEFDAFNAKATLLIGDCEVYTYCRPDSDKDYVWARIEHTEVTDLPILNEAEAIEQGMVSSQEE